MRAEKFDVFISYSRTDWQPALDIERLISAASLHPFFDRRELSPGLPWVRALEDAIGKSNAAIILIGPRGFGNTQQYERELAFYKQTRDRTFRIIPVLLPGTSDPPAGFLQLLTWIDFSAVARIADAPDEIARLLRAINESATIDSPSHNERRDICPYRGLDAFREEDSVFYFGRGSIDDPASPVGELVAKTRTSPFVMVVGRSGSGKSSLVFAGLLPALRSDRDTFWYVLSLRPGPDPLRTLSETFNVRGENEGMAGYASKITEEMSRLRDGKHDLLGHIIRDYLEHVDGKPDRLLLFVDQWEELYAQASNDALGNDERAVQQRVDVDKFIDLLLQATLGAPVTVVATVRADFYDSLVRHPQLRTVLPAQQVNLTSMPRSELRLSIIEPAKIAGLRFDPPSLVDRILDDAGEDEGMLPLLQYALKETFAYRKSNVMTADSYERSGGVQRAIRTTAERHFERLSNEDQTAARQLFLRLVTPGEGQEDTRARAVMPAGSDLQKIIQNFAGPKARLLVTGRDRAGRATVEVAHEALIRTWPRLREWIDKNREMLRARAAVLQAQADWEHNGRRNDLLLPTGFQLERARVLLEAAGDITIDDIQEYISKSLTFEQNRLDHEKQEELEDARRAADAERVGREVAEAARKKFQRYFIIASILGLFAIASSVDAMLLKRAAVKAQLIAENAQQAEASAKAAAETERDKAKASLVLAERFVAILTGELQTVQGIRISTLRRILSNSQQSFDEFRKQLSTASEFRTGYANMLSEFGKVYLKAGDLAMAQSSFEDSLKIRESAFDGRDQVGLLRGIAEQIEQLAKVQQQAGNLTRAAEYSERALNLRNEIVNRSDTEPESFRDLGLSLYRRGDLVKLMTGDAAADVEIQQTARTMMMTAESLGGNKPVLDMYLALIHGSLGDAYQALGNDAKLRESLVESLNLLKSLHADYPDNAEFTRYLTWAHQALGNYFFDQRSWTKALEQYQACLTARQMLAKDPEDWISQYDLAWAYHNLGAFYLNSAQPDLDKAMDYHETAYDIREKLTHADPSNKRWQKDFALSYESLGDVSRKKNNLEDARDNYEGSRSILQALVDSDPNNGGWVTILSGVRRKLTAMEANTPSTEAAGQPE